MTESRKCSNHRRLGEGKKGREAAWETNQRHGAKGGGKRAVENSPDKSTRESKSSQKRKLGTLDRKKGGQGMDHRENGGGLKVGGGGKVTGRLMKKEQQLFPYSQIRNTPSPPKFWGKKETLKSEGGKWGVALLSAKGEGATARS